MHINASITTHLLTPEEWKAELSTPDSLPTVSRKTWSPYNVYQRGVFHVGNDISYLLTVRANLLIL